MQNAINTDNSWLIGTWSVNIPNFGTLKLIFHDSENYTSIHEDFGLETKGTYSVSDNEITFYPKESNAPSDLKSNNPKPYSKKFNKENQTIEFSAETGDYYRKVR